jgi:hypothetical protein
MKVEMGGGCNGRLGQPGILTVKLAYPTPPIQGLIDFHTPMLPLCRFRPNAISRIRRGIPIKNSMMM